MKFREAYLLTIALVLAVFLGLGWYETRLLAQNNERRITAVEKKPQNIINIYDRYNEINLNGEDIGPEWPGEKP